MSFRDTLYKILESAFKIYISGIMNALVDFLKSSNNVYESMQHTFFSKNIKGIFFQLQHFQLFVWVHKKIITTVSTTKNYLPTQAKIFCIWLCDKSFKKSIVWCVDEIADAFCQKIKLSVIQKVSTIFLCWFGIFIIFFDMLHEKMTFFQNKGA